MACSEEGKDLQQGAQISVKGQINNLKQKNSFKHHSHKRNYAWVSSQKLLPLSN